MSFHSQKIIFQFEKIEKQKFKKYNYSSKKFCRKNDDTNKPSIVFTASNNDRLKKRSIPKTRDALPSIIDIKTLNNVIRSYQKIKLTFNRLNIDDLR